jgi:hypothetical protein
MSIDITYQIRRRKEDVGRVFNEADFVVLGESPEWRVTHQPSQLVFWVSIDSSDSGETWDWFSMLGSSRGDKDDFSGKEITDFGRLAINAVITSQGLE